MNKKIKYYIIAFCILFFSLFIYGHVKNTRGITWNGRRLHYYGLEYFIASKNNAAHILNKNITNGIYKAAIQFANTVSWVYDPTYYKIDYPNGDVPSGGACTDVVIRVLRKNDIDLQQLIHEDMASHFSAYPQRWGLNRPDANIDHRRVLNIMKYFERQRFNLPITTNTIDYKPGDIVAWNLSPGITHIGIVLENQDVFHNMGPTSRIESGFLFTHTIIGHYRILKQ